MEEVGLECNGTIAIDAVLLTGAKAPIHALTFQVHVHVLNADTYGTVKVQCAPSGIHVEVFSQEGVTACKQAEIRCFDNEVCSIGNGFNEIEMFDQAALSIEVLEGEKLCAALLSHAHMLARSMEEALDLLLILNSG